MSYFSFRRKSIDVDGGQNELREEGKESLAPALGWEPFGLSTTRTSPATGSSCSRNLCRVHGLMDSLTPLSTLPGGATGGHDNLKKIIIKNRGVDKKHTKVKPGRCDLAAGPPAWISSKWN